MSGPPTGPLVSGARRPILHGMARSSQAIKRAGLAIALTVAASSAAPAQDGDAPPGLDALLGELAEPEADHARVARRVTGLWSRSGSEAMDYLLRRGRDAMEDGDWEAAIDHLTALTDHAPDFAEGYNARAQAYFRSGRTGPALADIERTLALEPRHFEALAGLGFVMIELGDLEAALIALRSAAAIHPAIPEVNDAIERLERDLEGTAA